MNYEKKDIKEGITFHNISTNKFKTNLFAIFLTTPLTRENVTKNALISAVLRMGTKDLPEQRLISQELENMYGASFDCGVEKNGDNQVLKFYLEVLNDEYLPEKEELSKKALELLVSIVASPATENGAFKYEYVESEKHTLRRLIEGKIDNKARYALDRCTEEMYKDKPFGLYKYGYVEDLDSINNKELYEYYKELLSTCKIDVFASGFDIDNLNEDKILDIFDRKQINYIQNKFESIKNEINEPKVVTEKMDVTQGKLMIGMDIADIEENQEFAASVYSVILGGGANSKLFQNVREKESLAYAIGASYIKKKNSIFIRSGIEISNYEKALNLIKKQLELIKNNDFSDDEIESAKQLLYASLKGIKESQDSEIIYNFSNELSGKDISIEENIEKIKDVTREEIIDIAKKVQINTIYFLTGNEK